MTAPVNDRDVLLQAATIRNLSVGTTRALLLTSDTQVFHVTTGGAGSPSSINFTASLLGITGTVAFAASPTCTLTGTGLTRALTFTAFGANQQVTITATVTDTFSGQVFTATQVVNRVADGATGGAGGPGPAGSQSGISYLYQFSSISPATPTGVATYSWNAATTTYSNTDSWRGTVPSNPGTPGVQLWVLIAPLTAPAGTLTSTVSFSGISPVA
jgi:hypothetical protein